MRALNLSGAQLPASAQVMRPGPSASDGQDAYIEVEGIAELPTPSGAMYIGPMRGENGRDGIVVRTNAASVQVIATRLRDRGTTRLVALSLALSANPQDAASRGPIPPASVFTQLPGPVPILSSGASDDPIIASDAGVRDGYRSSDFRWDDWVREVAIPQFAQTEHPSGGCAAAAFEGRNEYMVGLTDTRSTARECAVYADLDTNGSPICIHVVLLAKASERSAPRHAAPKSYETEAHQGAERRAEPAAHGYPPQSASSVSIAPSEPGHQPGVMSPASGSTPVQISHPIDADAEISGSTGGSSSSASRSVNAGAGATSAPSKAREQQPASTAEKLRRGLDHLDREEPAEAIPLFRSVLRALDDDAGPDAQTQALLDERDFTLASLADLLCDLEIETGNAKAARDTLRRALVSSPVLAAPLESMHLNLRLGELELDAGHLPDAIGALERGRGTAKSFLTTADPRDSEAYEFAALNEAQLSVLLAEARLRSGDSSLAANAALDAAARFESLDRHGAAGRAGLMAAMASLSMGDQSGHEKALERAAASFRAGQKHQGLGIALGYLAKLQAERGDYQTAVTLLLDARDELEAADRLEDAISASESLAICFERSGEGRAAIEAQRAAALLRRRVA